jgi:hypothetical protein
VARGELALGWRARSLDPAWRGNGRVVIPLAQQEVEAPRPVAMVLVGSVLNHGFPSLRRLSSDQASTHIDGTYTARARWRRTDASCLGWCLHMCSRWLTSR